MGSSFSSSVAYPSQNTRQNQSPRGQEAGAGHCLAMLTGREAKHTPPRKPPPPPPWESLPTEELPETHRAQVFSVIGGTDHVSQDKGDEAGGERLSAVNPIAPSVVHDKHLGFLQLWCECGVHCGGAQRAEKGLLAPLGPGLSPASYRLHF